MKNPRQGMPVGLPFRLQDYLELLDWTGRQLRADKRGAIDRVIPLKIDAVKALGACRKAREEHEKLRERGAGQ